MKARYLLLCAATSLGACYMDDIRPQNPYVPCAQGAAAPPEEPLSWAPPPNAEAMAPRPDPHYVSTFRPRLVYTLMAPPGAVLSTPEEVRQRRYEEAMVQVAEAQADQAATDARFQRGQPYGVAFPAH